MGSEGTTTTSRRRILDYLNDGEELGLEGPAPAAAPRAVAAARSLLPRFRWARMARLGRKSAGVKVRRPVEVAAERDALEDSSAVSACATAGSETRAADLGVGLGLVFLLAKTSDEFSKMAKVRAEMETLLAEFKGHVVVPNLATTTDGGGVSTRARNIESAASSCLTDGNEPRVANGREEDRRRDHQVASCSGVGVQEVSSRKRPTEDVLEEEFHAELERLHVHYGEDSPPFLMGDERDGAEPSDDDGIGIDVVDCRQGFAEDDDDDDHGHDDDDHDDFDEDEEDDAARYRGVSAVELERRLHELLHQRNQERIEELEAALRRAERRLFEKEMEASLWKDTAKMALRQDDDDELQ
uniref:Uncharacterized protein n=2 Tax=Avena sativa TaxID=4498 RepID=A0ACD5Z8C6_AVESA